MPDLCSARLTACGPGGMDARHAGRERGVDPAQFGESFLGLRELALEQSDLLEAFFTAQPERVARCLAVAIPDHFADFAQREAELLGLENDRKAVRVLAPVTPAVPLAAGAEQSAAFVEAQRAQAYVEFPGEIPDRIGGFVALGVGRISGALDPENVVRPGKHLRRVAIAHSHSSCGRSRDVTLHDISVTLPRKGKKCARGEQ